ncbi:MAG TPA: hypothetical protein VGM10_15235 [Actinocrinis sp.]|jgi:hypothetical protein
MGESLHLGIGPQRVIQRMLEEPDRAWSNSEIIGICNDSERGYDEVVSRLIEVGALTAETTDRRFRVARDKPYQRVRLYRFTEDGPALARRVLESSRYSRGFFGSLLWEGWEPTKASLDARRARRMLKRAHRRERRHGKHEERGEERAPMLTETSRHPRIERWYLRYLGYRGRKDPTL